MLNITTYQGNGHQSYNDIIISYLTGCLLLKNLSIVNTEKDVEKRKPLYIFGGNIK